MNVVWADRRHHRPNPLAEVDSDDLALLFMPLRRIMSLQQELEEVETIYSLNVHAVHGDI